MAKNRIVIGLRTTHATTNPQRNEHTNGEPKVAIIITPMNPHTGNKIQTTEAETIFHFGVRDMIIAGINTIAWATPRKKTHGQSSRYTIPAASKIPTTALIAAKTAIASKLQSAFDRELRGTD